MDFEFPPDTLKLRDLLRRFVQKEVRPLEMKYFSAGRLEPEERARLRQAIEQMGLWGATVPEELGGAGLDPITACLLEEELGGTFIPLDMGEVPSLLYRCSEQQTSRYLEPALAGERRAIVAAREAEGLRPDSWTTTADGADGEYVLQGRKTLAGRPDEGDFFIVLARSPEGVTAFLLEQGTSGTRVESAPGSAAAGSNHTLLLEGCRLGSQAVLGEPGKALTALAERGPQEWIRTGARYVGMVERLRTMAAEHARDWVSLGEPLGVRPAVQRMLADLSAEVEAGRWLVYHAAWLADGGQPVRAAAARVRLFTGELLQRAIDRVTMIYGGPSPSAQVLPHRLARSAVPAETLELALEYARAVLAAEALQGS